ncbi:MAG: type II toxin-antitoxin system VapC family toxin [Proteobacteria bacterium]|nr:type II toxin-antitoxin system VapC family toxin [Pseudomonadota bacterium]
MKNQKHRPKVYLETSIISYLAAKPSNDLRAAANQDITTEWWEIRKPGFDLYISAFVEIEVALGDPEAAARRIEIIENISRLEITADVETLGKALIVEGSIPRKAEIDAFHIAIAAVNGIEYLLTWNCTHIANAIMRPKIEATCRGCGFEPPVICTPQELMEN